MATLGEASKQDGRTEQSGVPFPVPHAKFLGAIMQNYRPRQGAPASAFQTWIDKIGEAVRKHLVPALNKADLLLEPTAYETAGIAADYCLATIPDFNSLIARSQEHQVPIFALTPEQLNQRGIVLDRTIESRDRFRTVFSDLAEHVIAMTSVPAGA